MGAIARRIVSERGFTIANASDTSEDVSVESASAGLLLAASGYVSNAAATFEASNDGTTFYPVNGASVTLVAGEWVRIPEDVMVSKFMRVVIGANATQEETLTLALKG